MSIGLIFLVALSGCSTSDSPRPKSRSVDEMTWALENMVSPSRVRTDVRPSEMATSITTARTSLMPSPSPLPPSIVDLSSRPLGLIRNTYHVYIRREIIADASRTSFEKFNLFGIPKLIDQFKNSFDTDIAKMILLVSGELMANSPDDQIVSRIAPVCSDADSTISFPTSRTVRSVISNRFKYVLENFPLANFDLVCPETVRLKVEFAYSVFLQKSYRESILGPLPEGGEAKWTLTRLDKLSTSELLTAGLTFMSKSSADRLKLGIEFPADFSKREWFDRFVAIIFDSKQIESEINFFPNLEIPFSRSKTRAIGKFIALCVLEMEPVGRVFSDAILNLFLGKIEPMGDFQQALFEGFNSLIPLTSLGFLDTLSLGEILLGRSVAVKEINVHLPSYPQLLDNPQVYNTLLDWGKDAWNTRGIAIGSFGPSRYFLVQVVDDDTASRQIGPGAVVTVSRRELMELARAAGLVVV